MDNVFFSPGTKLVLHIDNVLLCKPIRPSLDYILLQKDIDAVGSLSMTNYLKFNTRKCKAMVFPRNRSATTPNSPLTLNKQTLDLVDMVKYLG